MAELPEASPFVNNLRLNSDLHPFVAMANKPLPIGPSPRFVWLFGPDVDGFGLVLSEVIEAQVGEGRFSQAEPISLVA